MRKILTLILLYEVLVNILICNIPPLQQKDKGLRILVLKTAVTLLKNTELPWDDNSLIGAVSEIINGVATAFKGQVYVVSILVC